MRIAVARQINAPIDVVFDTVADIRNFSQALPHIVKYEFHSEQRTGVGTRFRETRLMQGKAACTELEVTEHVQNAHIRMIADSHGAIWDTTFRVANREGLTELTMVMDSTTYTLTAKVVNVLFKGVIARAVRRDMDLVKTYCESAC